MQRFKIVGKTLFSELAVSTINTCNPGSSINFKNLFCCVNKNVSKSDGKTAHGKATEKKDNKTAVEKSKTNDKNATNNNSKTQTVKETSDKKENNANKENKAKGQNSQNSKENKEVKAKEDKNKKTVKEE